MIIVGAVVVLVLAAAFFVSVKLIRSYSNASEEKSKFLARMSHEIRTPMNAIIGIAEIELENPNISEETKESFSRIYSSGHMLLGIINDILDLSKIESGKFELNPSDYATASLINDVVQMNVIRIGSKPIEFSLKVNENMPAALHGDELRIKQVLSNLLSNAIKYTDEGEITLQADSREEAGGIRLIFTVRDTGQGMTREQLSAIYDDYSRFSSKEEGTGLGMSITKKLVEQLGGTIHPESRAGEGTTISVRLLQQPVGTAVIGSGFAYKKNKPEIKRERLPHGSVLIVDDTEPNIFVAKGMMKPYGLQTDTAESGLEVLAKVRDGAEYDIIFMDHMMPGMDGMETTKRIRAHGYTKPVVALTANAVVGQAALFLQNGFDDFLSKPIDSKELDTIIGKYIKPMTKLSAKRLAKLDASIAEGDFEAFRIEIHGLKSVLRYAGDTDKGDLAELLEYAARDGNHDYCRENYPPFRDSLAEPEEITEKTPGDIIELVTDLPKAKAAAEAYDNQGALAVISRHRSLAYNTAIDETIEAIIQALEAFECDRAVALIDELERS